MSSTKLHRRDEDFSSNCSMFSPSNFSMFSAPHGWQQTRINKAYLALLRILKLTSHQTKDKSSAALLWLCVCIKLSDAVRVASSVISQAKDSRNIADKDTRKPVSQIVRTSYPQTIIIIKKNIIKVLKKSFTKTEKQDICHHLPLEL